MVKALRSGSEDPASGTEVNNYGPGLASLLTVLFVGLKLTGYIDWSWLWVLAPLWISFLVAVVLIVAIALAVELGGEAVTPCNI